MSGGAGSAGRFRPDLEGLRAVAVGLVLLYHARVPGFTGGFVGVDVFFVLSGFLITGLLVRELSETGRVSLPAFYARRARRLLPAAAVTLAVTVVASAIVLPPLLVPDVAADGAAAALYVSNLRFAVQATDYLGAEAAPSPLLHFWSLGVEEQFYLFWPAFLTVVAGGAFAAGDAARGLRRVTVAVAATLVGSLALAVWLTDAAAPWAFFSLPSRAWELAIGGLLALPLARRTLAAPVAAPLGWTGVGLIALAGVALGNQTPFPGTAALLPTVGTALVIFAGGGAPGAALAPGRLLSLAPFRFVGRISYSLYLWHWPLIVLPAAAVGGDLPLAARIALVLLAVPVAAASQRWIEDPIRHGRYVGTATWRNLRLAGALTLAVAVGSAGMGLVSTAGLGFGAPVGGDLDDVPLPTTASTPVASGHVPPGTIPPTAAGAVPADLAPPLVAARDDLPPIYSDGCHLDVRTTASGTCAYAATGSTTTVVLFGDSHAAQWFPALERIAVERGWRLVSLTKSACPSADVPVWNNILRREYMECTTWRAGVIQRLETERPALVVTTNSHDHAVLVDGERAAGAAVDAAWTAGLERTLVRLGRAAGTVVLLGDTPRHASDPPACLSEHLDDALACATPREDAVPVARLTLEGALAVRLGVHYVDPTPWVCPSDPCPVVVGRFLVYRDVHHLTQTYARALADRLGARLPLP